MKSVGTDPNDYVSAAAVKPEISLLEWTPETVLEG
jgi:hypothetical protein